VSSTDPRREIPRTDALLADPEISTYAVRLTPARVRRVVASVTATARAGDLAAGEVRAVILDTLASTRAVSVRPVLNATGVIVHTNLGRAPLTQAARAALLDAAGYVDVEFDLASGERATRGRGTLEALLAAVPEAGAALVVNNGAAALSLAVTALAQGRELLVSRGELVEIGDGFRLPELIAATGVTIREVGTTNRTHAQDYRAAIGPATAGILKVHPSNFRISGFTSEVSVAACAQLAGGHGIPLIVDIGSGLLAANPLLPDEPDAASTLAAGADLVTGSGDKLLGGPQAGIILGSVDLVRTLRRHPLARAFRADKLVLAALEATLTGPESLVAQYLRAPELLSRTRALCEQVRAACPGLSSAAAVVEASGAVGGGGGAGLPVPGYAVALPEGLAPVLRGGDPPIVARVEGGHTLIDLRCVPPDDDGLLLAGLVAALNAMG